MSATVATHKNVFAESFWSIDTSAQEVLFKQNEKGTKTLNSLAQLYKEFIHLENEYSRKFSSLVKKMELPKHEYSSTLKTSIDVFQEQCLKISDSHNLQSRRVYESLQIPLQELISERRAREKSMEAKIQQSWSSLMALKAKCITKSKKHEEIWNEISNLKSRKLTLDQIEIEKLDDKIVSMKKKMYQVREEHWNLVNTYNESLKNWSILWWESCNEWQMEEEKRIRFIKANLWEYANILNMFCVEEDKYCDVVRTSLQDCSARKDINNFSRQFQTGDETFAPMVFIDFTKNEKRPLTETLIQKFDQSQIPKINPNTTLKIDYKKRNPPPEIDETTESAFNMIGRSKELFKELQEEAQKEASQMKLETPKPEEEALSEPSTKVMSDYSNPTTQTSILSNSFDESIENIIGSRLNEITKSATEINDEDIGDEFETNLKNKTILASPSKFENKDILRDSMIPAQKKDKSAKRNSLSTILKKAFTETPETNSLDKFGHKQVLPKHNNKSSIKGAQHLSNNSLMLSADDKRRASKLMTPERKASNSMRKSKSQYNMNNNHLSLNDLPATSIEGFPIVSHCRALYGYSAQLEEELSFKKRDILLILHKQKDGWWFAENLNSKDSGLVPCNYLKEIQ